MNELTTSLSGLRDLFFPRLCCVCEASLDLNESGLCKNCFSELPLTYFWDWKDNPVYNTINSKVPVEAAISLFYFRPDAKFNHIMHSIKYFGNRKLGYRLGYYLGSFLAGSPLPKPDAVIPVPLHPLRRLHRGYNQAEVIGRGIADALGVGLYRDLLRRSRNTHSQANLKTSQKEQNVKGAFKISRKEAQKMAESAIRHILIVDDTLTTGSTIVECAKCLKEDFKISAATLAYSG